MKGETYSKEKKNAKLKGKKIRKIRNNAEKCEYLSHLELNEGRKVQEREEKRLNKKLNKLKVKIKRKM